MNFTVRTAAPGDYGFIVHSALFEIGEHHMTKVERKRVDFVFKPIIDAVVRGAERVAVACADDDVDALVGWGIANQHKVIFIYVSHDYRGRGINDQLRKFIET